MTIYKTCSFFGHREIEIDDKLKNKLKSTLEYMIACQNYGIFYFGGFGMFDYLCWEIVSELKNKYPFIKRIFCLSDPRHQKVSKRPKWLKDENYEEFIYIDLSFDWWYKRIYFRNIEMINRSDFVIFYINHNLNSGAYKAYQFARLKKKDFINIA